MRRDPYARDRKCKNGFSDDPHDLCLHQEQRRLRRDRCERGNSCCCDHRRAEGKARASWCVCPYLPCHKVSTYMDFVSEFSMNAAGKILKYKMRENAIEKLDLQKAEKVVTA